jgi:hypothetical protein
MLCVIAWLPRYCYRLGDVWVNEVSVAAFAASIDKAGILQIGYQFSDLRRHVYG